MRRVGIVLFLVLSASRVAAQLSDDPTLRHYFVPFVKSATNCIAGEAIKEHAIVGVRSKDDLEPIIRDVMSRCQRELNTMVARGNQIYGFGGGRDFLEHFQLNPDRVWRERATQPTDSEIAENALDGPYMADLPRAVMLLLKKDLPARQAEFRRQDAEAVAAQDRTEQERRDREARDAESRRLARDRADADERAARDRARAKELEAQEERRKRTDEARRSMELLRDDAFDCVRSKMTLLVKSGESADVIAGAAMTFCSEKVEAALHAAIELANTEKDTTIDKGSNLEEALIEKGRSIIRERAVAIAVEMKAQAR